MQRWSRRQHQKSQHIGSNSDVPTIDTKSCYSNLSQHPVKLKLFIRFFLKFSFLFAELKYIALIRDTPPNNYCYYSEMWASLPELPTVRRRIASRSLIHIFFSVSQESAIPETKTVSYRPSLPVITVCTSVCTIVAQPA